MGSIVTKAVRATIAQRVVDTERRINESNDRLRELGIPTLGEHTEFFKLLRHVDKMLADREQHEG